ncbi:MAG TPA: polyphenol oxidase family protein [Acidobacteriota bacterium]|nr:polyphenol oxidase family protein [Acidobacteriota bacterium]
MILRDGILLSEVLVDQPLVHGFTTRQWGNLGFGKNPGDPEVIENRKRLFQELSLAARDLIQPKQVHSSRAVSETDFAMGFEADATYGRSPAALHSILTADCVPLLAYHPEGIVAAIHAGWRGLLGGVILETLRMLPPRSIVAIGPAIGPCCYEVGEEVASKFEQEFGAGVVNRSGPKPHLDLVHAAILQSAEAGVEECDAAHLCTACHPDLFYSYRRDGSSGRQMSFIGLK